MSMNNTSISPENQQIITAYEELSLTPEEIAISFGLEPAAVKMILVQNSLKFKQDNSEIIKQEGGQLSSIFSPEEENLAKRTIVDLASGAEVEGVRLKAAQYIIDERKGRNDVKALQQFNNFSLTVINETMNRARAAMAKAREKSTSKVVDVDVKVA